MENNSKKFDLIAVLDSPVVDGEGERLGNIGELIVNPDEGHIEFAKLWLFSDASPRPEVLVPWSQFNLSADRGNLQLNISLPVLRAAATRPRTH